MPGIDPAEGAASIAMIELTTVEGAALWLVVGSIYAIERDPNESFTLVKTAAEPIAVVESPQTIFERIQAMMAQLGGGSQESLTQAAYDQFMGVDPNDL